MDEITLVIKVAQEKAYAGTLTALFAALAAGISALIAYKQHTWSKRNTRVLLTPSLEAHVVFDYVDSQFELEVENRGLGPARIGDYEYTWEGEKINDTELKKNIQLIVGTYFEITVWQPALSSPCTISPNRKVVPIRVKPYINQSISEPCQEKVLVLKRELANKMRLTITYVSLLDITAKSKEVFELKVPRND